MAVLLRAVVPVGWTRKMKPTEGSAGMDNATGVTSNLWCCWWRDEQRVMTAPRRPASVSG